MHGGRRRPSSYSPSSMASLRPHDPFSPTRHSLGQRRPPHLLPLHSQQPPSPSQTTTTSNPSPLPSVDGLPDAAEATVDVSMHEIQYLKTAYDLLQHPVKRFIANESPDWIIHDFSPYWVIAIAREFRVPCIEFLVFSAAAFVFAGPPESMTEDGRRKWRPSPESMTSRPEWVPFPSTVAFRRHEAEGFYLGMYGENTSGVKDAERLRLAAEGCQAVAMRTCPEYEGEYLALLEELYKKPVIPVGLLPPPSPEKKKANDGDVNDGWSGIFRWLDGQAPKSVVFVSFGSEYKLTKNEVHELAHGLEQSGIPFLWALRRPIWASGEGEEALPLGFTSRTEGRGVISMGWAPQLEILAHPAVGGSLFHSGWGSIIETLRYGHALILLPFIIDQGLNARLLVEKGLAIEVERNDDGSFHRDAIAGSLRRAMASQEGEEMRVSARKMGAIFADQGLHDKYVSGFIDYLSKCRNNQLVHATTKASVIGNMLSF